MAFIGPAYPNTTQNNTSGSNTSITGGYTSSATNTYQSGSSNNTTTTNNSTSNIRSAPPTASAPSCNQLQVQMSVLAGASQQVVQTFGIGVSGGKSFRDKNCERIKLSRELNSLRYEGCSCSHTYARMNESFLLWNKQAHHVHLKVRLVKKQKQPGRDMIS